jgi:hypothetical protein
LFADPTLGNAVCVTKEKLSECFTDCWNFNDALVTSNINCQLRWKGGSYLMASKDTKKGNCRVFEGNGD